MVLLRRRRTMAAKVEATIGTPETLLDADGSFIAYNMDIQGDIEVEEREDPNSFNRRKGSPGARGGTLTFRHDMLWDGTATLPAWAEVLFPACGFVKTGTTFTPRSEGPGTNVKTLTMGVWLGVEGTTYVFKSLAGAMGNMVFGLTSGMNAYIDFTFSGIWETPTDTTVISPTYPADDYFRYAGAATTWQGVSKCIQEATIDSGNNVIMRECATAIQGYESALITDRRPLINVNPEAVLVATDDVYGDWIAGTEGPLVFVLNGPNTSSITITAPKAQVNNPQEGDRDGIAIDNIEFACNKDDQTADQELSIEFTPTV